MAESNAERARRGFEAVLRGDLDTVAEMLDANVKWHGGDPTAEGACQNRDQALRWMQNRPTQAELVDVIEAGDKVIVLVRPAGEAEPVANVSTFRDGKVVEMVHYADPAEARRAAGLPVA